MRAFFALRDLLLERTGCCPNFEVLLAQEWTFVLLEEATAADHAQVLRRGALGRAP